MGRTEDTVAEPAPPQASEAILATARALRLDRVAAEVLGGLGEQGIDAILLKGAVLARWLYADGTPRGYGDVDVLVAPDRYDEALAVLAGLGFRHGARGKDQVDLHDTIAGLGVHPSRAWPVLRADAVPFAIGGHEGLALAEPARALHVALHAAWHGPEPKPLADLERAVRLVDEPTWRAAARLAEQLSAADGLVTGLDLVDAGRALRERLGLPAVLTPRARLGFGAAPPGALRLTEVVQGTGPRAKARALRRAVVPSAETMRVRHALARRGGAGLLAAHAVRIGRVLAGLPAAVARLRRARRRAA